MHKLILCNYCFSTLPSIFFSEHPQSTGWTALFFAAKDGDLDLTRLLIKGGATVELKDKVQYYFQQASFFLMNYLQQLLAQTYDFRASVLLNTVTFDKTCTHTYAFLFDLYNSL